MTINIILGVFGTISILIIIGVWSIDKQEKKSYYSRKDADEIAHREYESESEERERYDRWRELWEISNTYGNESFLKKKNY